MTATYGLTSIRTLREAQISIGFIKVYGDFFPGLLISGLFVFVLIGIKYNYFINQEIT